MIPALQAVEKLQ